MWSEMWICQRQKKNCIFTFKRIETIRKQFWNVLNGSFPIVKLGIIS